MMATRLGVGVIGVGTIGRRHAENLAWRIPRARLVAVADVRPEVARIVAGELNATHWFVTADELAAHPDVEAVVIASSHHAHLEGIAAAARHRKDVFCEKPIAPTLTEADQALAAVTEANVRLQIGFMRRYDPAYVAAKQRIEAGEIGEPVLFKATHRNPSLPPSMQASADAGVFVDTNIHDYDNARWLLVDEVTEVHAVAVPVLEPARSDDLALSTLRFARGGLGSVEAYLTCAYAYDVRTEVAGTKGTIFIGRLQDTACLVATANGVTYDAVDHWLARFGDAYLIQLDDWVRRTLAGDLPAVTGADGRAALEIAIAARRSSREGRSIRVPLD
jgi:scyllo-inositol 2-dehydrogenase (NAD+)